MAGAVMPQIDTLQAFRTGQELSSTEPAQLRRTIEDLEASIDAKDTIIEQQLQAIERLELAGTSNLSKKNILPPLKDDERLNLLQRIEDQARTIRTLETIQEEHQISFEAMIWAQTTNIDNGLKLLDLLPASSDTKALHARISKEHNAIGRQLKNHRLNLVTALKLLTDLQAELIQFLIARPVITYRRAMQYRAEVLADALYRDPGRKSIKTSEAQVILCQMEDRPIQRTQAIRAMRWAASIHPDKVRFEASDRTKARICKTGGS